MRVRIIDLDALDAINPAALRAYAIADGWEAVESFGAHSKVFHKGGLEAIIPGTTKIADYANVVAELIGVFAHSEGRDQLQTYRDLVTADKDVVRVRSMSAAEDGSVEISAGVEMVVHARDLVLSAACSAWSPQPMYRAGRVKLADDFMSRVRLGQTEQSSFVVTLLTPVPPAIQPMLDGWPGEVDEPFERRVTKRLSTGLDAAASAIERYNLGSGMGVFESAVSKGLSANLCDAVAQLSDRTEGIEFSITWARTRPTPQPRWRRVLSRAEGETLKEVARVFRQRQPRPDETIEGFIIKLAREENEFDGRVTLKAIVDGRWLSINSELRPQDYELAIAAHRDNSPISMTGTLERQGQRWHLTNPRLLHLVSEEIESDIPPSGPTP